MQVLVTRPDGQQQPLMQALVALGHRPQHCPALVIEPLPLSDAQRRELMDLDLFHGVFFASANAARLALTAMADLWPQWPVGLHWLAVGKATAAELQRWQLSPTVPETGFNSEAVLALPCLQDLDEKKLLLCRGESGRELLAQTLRQRGAQVTEMPFYRRLANRNFFCPADVEVVLVTSVESWQAMAGTVPAGCTLVAAGERVAQVIAQRHRGPLRVAASAHDDDMLMALPTKP